MRKALLAALTLCLAPLSTAAHEVYVLPDRTIADALAAPSPNPFTAYSGNEMQFYLWGLVSFIVFSTVLAAVLFRVFERSMGPLFMQLKQYAHLLVRLTAGSALIAFALAGELYGMELSIASVFGAAAPFAQLILGAIGAMLLLGFYTRPAASIALGIFALSALQHGWYLIMYIDHAGAYLLLMALGSGRWSLDFRSNKTATPGMMRLLPQLLMPYAFPILRVAFGVSIMFAAFYAKFLHSELALRVVEDYALTHIFPFEPLFIVLGALIIEFLAGLLLFLGIAVRWTSVFLLGWLILAQFYFQEPVWPHFILMGVGLALFCHGYDRYSLGGYFLKRGRQEPIL